MVWARRGIIYLLSLVLLVSLVGGAFSISSRLNLTHAGKLETWLRQSNFYSSVVTNELHDAQQSASNDVGAGRVSLGDPSVQQAVRAVFSADLLQQYTDTFLNSNYAWLEGKTSTPNFTIDLTGAKQKLAQQIGQQVKTRVAALPVCSNTQLAQLQSTLDTDPLAIPCRPPTLTADTAAAQASAQISGSQDFLNNPALTAIRLNPNGNNSGQPYFQRLSTLPKLYRLNLKLPWIFGVAALVSLVGIIFISLRRRRGIRQVGIVFLVAGLVLMATKFVADAAFNRLQKKVFSDSSIGQLQQSLTDFLHRVEAQLVKVDLWFGAACLLAAVLIFGILWLTRQKPGNKELPPPGDRPLERPETDRRAALPVFKQPPKPKRPRLIQ